MINSVCLKNYGPISDFACGHLHGGNIITGDNFSGINIVVGDNGAGKTFLLKALYSAIKSAEEYRRGNDIRSFNDLISEKLRWTFQVHRMGDLVTRTFDKPLSFEMTFGTEHIAYQFSRTASSKVGTAKAPVERREANSIFIPSKEILSLYGIILKSRDIDKSFGFDDTYYDLAKALSVSPKTVRGLSVEPKQGFMEYREKLNKLIGGKVELDEIGARWYYRNNNGQQFFPAITTSDGVKKIATLERLLANGYLSRQSVVFFDDIEANLNPTTLSELLRISKELAVEGMQFFITTHSCIVLEDLALIAQEHKGLVRRIDLD